MAVDVQLGEKNMEKTETLRKYELVIIVDAKLSSEVRETVCKEVTDLIKKHGGKVINSQVWLEKHKMTFQIQKCDEGTYYLINIEGDNEVIGKIKFDLKLNEKILRSAFIRIEAKADAKSMPSAVLPA